MRKILSTVFCLFLLSGNAFALNLARVKTWASAEILTAADLNAEFNNILNHSIRNADIASDAAIVASKLDQSVAGAIGATTASTGAFTTLSASGAATFNGSTTIGDATGDAFTINPSAWTLANAVTITGTWTNLGTVNALTAGNNLDIGNYELRSNTFQSDVAAGTAPLIVASTTKVTNLNADLLDGYSWTDIKPYFERDGTAIIEFDNASKGIDLSGNTVTLTSLSDTDLVDGLISNKCYNFDGSNDFVTIADNNNQAGMTALTIELVVNLDTITGTDTLINNDPSSYILVNVTSTQISMTITTDSGTESLIVNHDLTFAGQKVYIVLTWDSSSPSKLYINGTFKGNGNDSGNGSVLNNAGGINIGAASAGIQSCDGKIDGVRILRRKMSVAEISTRYATLINP